VRAWLQHSIFRARPCQEHFRHSDWYCFLWICGSMLRLWHLRFLRSIWCTYGRGHWVHLVICPLAILDRGSHSTATCHGLHLQTNFWHSDMLLRYCDIAMPYLYQNFQDFPRAMSFVPELCPRSQNTSHTYVSTWHTHVLTSTNYGKLQPILIGPTQSSVSFN
jgi:hypothetical protein